MPSLIIQCQCGQCLRADDEAGLLTAAHEHIAAAHPDLLGRLSDDDLRGMVRRA